MPRQRIPREISALPTLGSISGGAYSTEVRANEEWARFEAWASREQIPLCKEASPACWLVACYVMLRLTDPSTSPARKTVKVKTAEHIANDLKKYARLQGWDVSHLSGKATKLTAVLSAAKKLLPETQVTPVRARPITALDGAGAPAELDLLLDHLDRLEDDPVRSNWWVSGWRARILVSVQAPLRGGEAVTAAVSNLKQAHTTDGKPLFILTIPVSKANPGPKDLVLFCICESGRDRRCPVHALSDWLTDLAADGYEGEALFPLTPRYDPRLEPPTPSGPVRQGDLDGLRRLALEIVGDHSEDSLADFSLDVEFDFACRVCGTEDRETLRARASRKYSCRSCSKRASARATRSNAAGHGSGWFVDSVAVRLADPDFRPGRSAEDRHLNAIKYAHRRQRVQLQELCADAGVAPRHEFESITFHGLKRGGVTTLAAKNISDVDLQAFAQHASMETTYSYIDQHRPMPHATSFLEPWDGEADVSFLGDLEEVIRPADP